MVGYKILNIFFFVFHIALILFNVLGWMVPSLRKLNLVTLGLTLFSWVVLGIFYGFGYCFLTDWHWDVRGKLGYSNTSNSYIHFLIKQIFGVSPPERWVDIFTVAILFLAVIASVFYNVRGWRHR